MTITYICIIYCYNFCIYLRTCFIFSAVKRQCIVCYNIICLNTFYINLKVFKSAFYESMAMEKRFKNNLQSVIKHLYDWVLKKGWYIYFIRLILVPYNYKTGGEFHLRLELLWVFITSKSSQVSNLWLFYRVWQCSIVICTFRKYIYIKWVRF